MTLLVTNTEKATIREVKIVVGNDWIAHHFSTPQTPEAARARLLLILDALLPESPQP
jgi:hypothetical protein